jgi:hypothetical protein
MSKKYFNKVLKNHLFYAIWGSLFITILYVFRGLYFSSPLPFICCIVFALACLLIGLFNLFKLLCVYKFGKTIVVEVISVNRMFFEQRVVTQDFIFNTYMRNEDFGKYIRVKYYKGSAYILQTNIEKEGV